MSANDKQFGGDHYKGWEYEHWDFVTDLNLPYLVGCATKYPTRWRSKNGLEDLKKSTHFLEKAIERGDVEGIEQTDGNMRNLTRFTAQLPVLEAAAVREMVLGNHYKALDYMSELMTLAKAEAQPS